MEPHENPVDARQFAAELVERFERALAQEIPVSEAVKDLLYPALTRIRLSGQWFHMGRFLLILPPLSAVQSPRVLC